MSNEDRLHSEYTLLQPHNQPAVRIDLSKMLSMLFLDTVLFNKPISTTLSNK